MLYQREDEFCDKLNNRATFKGFTSLHYASLIGDYNLIKLLLEAGADPLIENDMGHRAIEYCTSDEQIKSLISSYEKIVSVLSFLVIVAFENFRFYYLKGI